jgi:signal-transduction protein with cAMP-binding, CBS, and nucleotidyltransferase domain
MSIAEAIERKPVATQPNDTLALVAKKMKKENVGAVVIVQDERPIGIVTDRDLALTVCLGEFKPSDPVRKIMTCSTRPPSG